MRTMQSPGWALLLPPAGDCSPILLVPTQNRGKSFASAPFYLRHGFNYGRCHCSGSFALFHIIPQCIPINLNAMVVHGYSVCEFLPTQLACVCNTKERATLGNCVAIGNPRDQLSPLSDDYCLAYGAAE